MARLHSSGFELNSNTSGIEFDTCNGAGASIQTTTVRSGTYAGKILNPATGVRTGWALRFASAGQDDVYWRVYIRVAAYPNVNNTVAMLHDTTSMTGESSPQCRIRLHTDGTLHVINDSGTDLGNSSALTLNQWYRLEARHESALALNVLNVKLDGTDIVNSTSESHAANAVALRVGANLEGQTCTSGEWYFDDIAINDENTSTAGNNVGNNQTGFPGEGSIVHLHPNAAGDFEESTLGAGSANAWENIDEFPPDDITTYEVLVNDSAGSTSADRLDVNVGAFSPSVTSITLVQLGVRAMPASNATCTFVLRLKDAASGTLKESSAVSVAGTAWFTNDDTATTRQPKLIRYRRCADDAAWTTSDLGTMQIGIRAPDANPDVRVTALWALVEYVAAAGSTYTLTADSQSYTLTGIAAGLKWGHRLPADQQTYTFTGVAAGLYRGYPMAAATGSFTLTGNDANLLWGHKLTAEQGAYTLTGNDATLTKTGAFSLAVDAGSFTLTGNDASFIYTPSAPARQQGAGSARRTKKRWWQIGDKVYQGTQEQAQELISALLRQEEPPKLKSKPAPKQATPKPASLAKVEVPDLPVWEFDWRPMYVSAQLQRDMEMALAIESAIRQRMAEDEEEIEMLLLLH